VTCFHPLDAAWKEGQGKPLVYGKGNPRPAQLAPGWEPMQLACGQCIGCRIDRSKEWAARCIHESLMHQENCFVTLTYNDEHLPANKSLDKTHFQKFMKRLRKHFDDKQIRYFHCGEYGERLSRPHYHACLFGIDFHDRVPFGITNDIVTFTSQTLEKLWGKGFCTVGELTYESAAYTARYIMKKITGKKADEHYQVVDEYGQLHKIEPEYVTMSLGRNKGEGIGGPFYQKYKTDFFPRDETPIPGRGVYPGVPRYYEELFAEEDPDTYAKIKERRKLHRDRHAGDLTPERLKQRETVKEVQLSQLPRN
jgi:hypothetical protein